jgi:hypothetical protein
MQLPLVPLIQHETQNTNPSTLSPACLHKHNPSSASLLLRYISSTFYPYSERLYIIVCCSFTRLPSPGISQPTLRPSYYQPPHCLPAIAISLVYNSQHEIHNHFCLFCCSCSHCPSCCSDLHTMQPSQPYVHFSPSAIAAHG